MSVSKRRAQTVPETIKETLKAAGDKQAGDLVVLDLRDVAAFTDFFVLATGANQKQLVAIVDAIMESLRRLHMRPDHIEGYPRQEWILLDYGSFVVHVFTPRTRGFYDLERLWGGAGRMEINP
ncbi:MAG: ribosome silencing factor [Vicinamibacteria bacterium]|nr:ribosome silencing factor [Vicinamibacteria bacterium]